MSDSSSSSAASKEETWDDWIESLALPTWSLIRPSVEYPSAPEALQHDIRNGFDLKATICRLGLDFLGSVRLINWIRDGNGGARSLAEVLEVKGNEKWLRDGEEFLRPRIEGDGMLQQSFDEEDAAEFAANTSRPQRLDTPDEVLRLRSLTDDLRAQLSNAHSQLASLKTMISNRFRSEADFDRTIPGSPTSALQVNDALPTREPTRDDDTHYFTSYASNDIHGVMLKDSVRTEAYRTFLQSNPSILKDKRVLDIGCGTGILSFFAASAGAKKVYAVDASSIAQQTAQHVRNNGLSAVVKVINKKSEDLSLDEDLDGEPVDLIVSEWMGYALLYEGFLPSVLIARDAFLRSGGSMAPSQCSMLLSAWGDSEWWNSRIQWWSRVYGYDLSPMAEETFAEAVIESFSPSGLCSSPFAIFDVHTPSLGASPRTCLTFTTPFELDCSKTSQVHGFLLWFDTWFTRDGRKVDSFALSEAGNESTRWKEADGEVGFSTGPVVRDTHWHQALFVLRKPISIQSGTKIKGAFSCQPNEDNSRELECTISWTITLESSNESSDIQAQVWKVR